MCKDSKVKTLLKLTIITLALVFGKTPPAHAGFFKLFKNKGSNFFCEGKTWRRQLFYSSALMVPTFGYQLMNKKAATSTVNEQTGALDKAIECVQNGTKPPQDRCLGPGLTGLPANDTKETDCNNLDQGSTAKILDPSEEGVEIIHHTRADVQTLLTDGLKSYEQLVSEGRLPPPSVAAGVLMSDQHRNIYFRAPFHAANDLEHAYGSTLNTSDWVAIKVAPDETYVFNSELRFLGRKSEERYKYCSLKLSKWLEYKRAAGEQKPGVAVLFDPCTAECIFTNWDDRRTRDATYAGLWEVIIPERVIPPRYFSSHGKQE